LKQSVQRFFRDIAENKEGIYNPKSGRLTSFAARTQEHVLKAVGSIIRQVKLSVALDVGSGPGRYIELYGNEKMFHVLVDAIPPMLLLAKSKARKLGFLDSTDFIVADVENLPIRTRSCEIVSCIDILHHLDQSDKQVAFRELARVAALDGYVLIEIKNILFPHYLLGLSRRNPAGVSTGSNYIRVRAFFRSEGFQDMYSTGALPWGLGAKVISPSIFMEFKRNHLKNGL